MESIFSAFVDLLINSINQIGYLGIFIGMFVESTFLPIPSELIMIPAGIASAKGLMNIYIATTVGIIGNVFGALFSYYLAASLGRKIILRVGRYFFVKEEVIVEIEKFFKTHGPISVFLGRLIPGFRHFISLPAGIAKMDLRVFLTWTTIGSSIWTTILAILGFLVGENQQLITDNLHKIAIWSLVICALIAVFYIFLKPIRK